MEEVLGTFPDTPDGRKAARELQAKLAKNLVRRGLARKFSIGVERRGGSYWVTLNKR
ncbi:hypothetical protein JJV70_15195 [Streptomyces sp. JJ66]|uniref:hypothetical protein n=1 Tax=Streptomyces sp. JJ66 TaxID=2803843 RepID=UPI001C5A4045|nr:hypothetical protein [Streptomyces sp. JJ66]MBW1603425.1 hypothetical protein [Streptomyces sp. JJ66]